MKDNKAVNEQEQEPNLEGVTLDDILDAVKELTSTVGDLVKHVDSMTKEYNLKKRAGHFDQTGIIK